MIMAIGRGQRTAPKTDDMVVDVMMMMMMMMITLVGESSDKTEAWGAGGGGAVATMKTSKGEKGEEGRRRVREGQSVEDGSGPRWRDGGMEKERGRMDGLID